MACVNDRCEIPTGTFIMGSDNGYYDQKTDDDTGRVITVTGFLIGKHEVTIGEYRKFREQGESTRFMAVLSGCSKGRSYRTVAGSIGESSETFLKRAERVYIDDKCSGLKINTITPREIPDLPFNKEGDDYPIVGLPYDAKIEYCQAQGGDLPTEAQIERASKGVDGIAPYGTPIDKAILWSNGYRTTQPVCGANDERANSFGICDLAGNVWESTSDAYREFFYSYMQSVDPYNPLTDYNQCESLRGGSFTSDEKVAAATYRYCDYPDYKILAGFRCTWPKDSK